VTKEPDHYLHGTRPKEQQRLAKLNGLLNDACLRELALQHGQRVLDVGCGLAQFARMMARAVGEDGCVVGVERNARQLSEARRRARAAGEEDRVQWRRGDALSLPLRKKEWGGFDVVHARFVLEHLAAPQQAVDQMVRAVRHGGRVVLSDDDHDLLRLHPEAPAFEAVWRAYVRVYDRLGCDPFVGRHLIALLHRAGARPVRNTWVFFGSCAGDANFVAYVENMIGVVETARDVITGELGVSPGDFDRAFQEARAWGRRPDAAIWFGLCWAEGVRP